MKKQNLLTFLLILNMFLLSLPITSQASTIELNQLANHSNDILLSDARAAAVTLLTGNTFTGKITGAGQAGATVNVYLEYNEYTTIVDDDGYWTVFTLPTPKFGDEVTAIQIDAIGNVTAFTGVLGGRY